MSSNARTNRNTNPSTAVPTQTLILPDTSSDQGSSKDVTGARSFVTQTWTIPDRPKPGRKPKQKPQPESRQISHQADQTNGLGKDSAGMNSTALNKHNPSSIVLLQPDSKTKNGESVTSPENLQQAYINSLEGKVESLQSLQSEQVHYYKTLASQSTSKANKLQSENDVLQSQIKILRSEVLRLRKRVSQLVKKSATHEYPNAIVIDDDSPLNQSKVRKPNSHTDAEHDVDSLESSGNCLKKPRHQSGESQTIEHRKSSIIASPPETSKSSQPPSEIYLVEDSHQPTQGSSASSTKRIPDFTSNDISCGLCTSELDCVCRQVGLKPPLQNMDPSRPSYGGNLSAVPIPRRSQPSATSSVWRIVTDGDSARPVSPEMEPVLTRECNGNPRDCPACRDDPFGQAFCTALNQAKASREPVTSTKPGTDLGNSSSIHPLQQSDPVVDAYMSIPCCGDPGLCGSQNCFNNAPSPADTKSEMKVSCSEAWRQLKAHPNIGLANLQLLADVVARKSIPFPSPSHSLDSSCSSSLDHSLPSQRYQNLSHSILSRRSSCHSTLENEDSSFSPHITLSTVFENTHGDLQDDHPAGTSRPFVSSPLPSSPYVDHDHTGSIVCHDRRDDATHQSNQTSLVQKHVKFVEKESLDKALRMLDRTGNSI